jgi:hypothetical protein
MKPNQIQAQVGTRYAIEIRDRRGRLVRLIEICNQVTTEGLNDLLEVWLRSGTQRSWYIGLIDDDSYTNTSAADTLASHTGWTEFSDYSGNRKAATFGAAASGQMDNSDSKAEFAVTAAGTIRGIFLASAASGTTGILLATAVGFAQDVEVGYSISVTVSAAADTQ